MASGGGSWKGLWVVTVAAVAVTVLATTRVWNPWPQVWSWITTSGPVAPGTTWQQTLGGTPQSVAIAGEAVIVEYRTSVEAYGLTAAVKLWSSDADWASTRPPARSGGPTRPPRRSGHTRTRSWT
jgi:outer membrane protein assembly factor BamB